MTLKVKYNKNELIQDFRRYMIYAHKKPLMEILVGALLVLVFALINYLNSIESINFYPIIFTVGLKAITVGVGILTAIEIVYLSIGLTNIRSKARNIPSKDETISIMNTHLEFTWLNEKFNYFWSSYKKAVLLNNSMFLIPKSRNGIAVRLNSSEIGLSGFKLVKEEIEKRFELIRN